LRDETREDVTGFGPADAGAVATTLCAGRAAAPPFQRTSAWDEQHMTLGVLLMLTVAAVAGAALAVAYALSHR
jgi:hypothetical protein